MFSRRARRQYNFSFLVTISILIVWTLILLLLSGKQVETLWIVILSIVSVALLLASMGILRR